MGYPKRTLGTKPTPRTAKSYEWDVFLSYASEDRAAVVQPLAQALDQRGYLVWYDQNALRLGSRLRRSIDRGLRHSRYAVVVLSKAYFQKRWPQLELDGLFALDDDDERILPVWHGIDESELRERSPIVADRIAVSSEIGITAIAAAIADVLGPPRSPATRAQVVANVDIGTEPEARAGAVRSLLGIVDEPSVRLVAEARLGDVLDTLPPVSASVVQVAPTPISKMHLLSRGPDRFDAVVSLGQRGSESDVDALMSLLASEDDIATRKLVDYGLGGVATVDGAARLQHYLFEGSQEQRNVAALYFRRRGNTDLLERAVIRGKIDRAQIRTE